MHTDTFTMQLADAPDVLARVVALCHRKQGTVLALHYEAGERHRPGRLELTVRAGRRGPELRTRLGELVGVVGVASPSLDLVAA
jgi:acetolactate synthase regulatory subunit